MRVRVGVGRVGVSFMGGAGIQGGRGLDTVGWWVTTKPFSLTSIEDAALCLPRATKLRDAVSNPRDIRVRGEPIMTRGTPQPGVMKGVNVEVGVAELSDQRPPDAWESQRAQPDSCLLPLFSDGSQKSPLTSKWPSPSGALSTPL